MARHDFKAKVKNQLSSRVAHRCSNPDCRVPTLGPKSTNNDSMSIGVAAHVCAASPGGPRFNPAMTVEQRVGFDNGIWLCSPCSIIIDRDESMYTVEVLNAWKKEAESKAKTEQGKKLPSDKDATEILVTAFSGQQKRLIPAAIATIHSATEQSLEELDKRFKITSSYHENTMHFTVRAKENVPIRLNVKGTPADGYYQRFQSLIEEGKDLEIPSNAVSFEGSKLFEEIVAGRGGTLIISGPKKKATLKFWATKTPEQGTIVFEDLVGDISIGTKKFTFIGNSCANIVKIELDIALDANCKAQFHFTLDLEPWRNKDILTLPYFLNIYNIHENISSGAVIHTRLEIDGNEVLTGKDLQLNEQEYIQETYCFLRYTKAARAISKYLDIKVYFNDLLTFSEAEYLDVLEAERIINNEEKHSAEHITGDITCNLELTKNLDNGQISSDNFPTTMVSIQEQGEALSLFGQNIKLPPKRITLGPVKVRPISNQEQFKVGDIVKIVLNPTEGFLMTTTFEPDNTVSNVIL